MTDLNASNNCFGSVVSISRFVVKSKKTSIIIIEVAQVVI